MAETSNWTVPGLIGYLVSVRPTLQSSETKRLQSTPVFPKEVTTHGHRAEDGASQKVQKFKVSDLYEPLEVFRELGLPIIDWQGKDGVHQWIPRSREGRLYKVWPLCMLTLLFPAKFLFSLGLRQYPSIGIILDIAAKGQSQGTAALNYFLNNYREKYHQVYTTKACKNIAFVPAIHKGKEELARPVDVFSYPGWQSLGFPVLDPSLGEAAAIKLKIEEHPPTSQLLHLLKESPPATEAQACEWFGILSRRISGLCNV